MAGEPSILFRLDKASGMPAYRQLVDQVRHAVQLGILRPGDRLPTVREVVTQIPINPNTVHRAYRELEHQGLTEGRPGSGTFITRALSEQSPELPELHRQLEEWLRAAREAGLDDEAITAVIVDVLHGTNARR